MNTEAIMKSRINGIFFSLCLALAVSPILNLLVAFFAALRRWGVPFSDYTLEVLLPQLFYPLLILSVFFFALRVLRIPQKELVRISRPRKDFFPWLGWFLGCVTVGNLFTNLLLDLFSRWGWSLPDPISGDAPATPGQAVGFFLVYAVLPALCEELVFRAGVAGSLKEFHPGVAVFVSGIGFALFHASLRQIPYAFAMGCVFAFLYVKTDNILYPILFHFINNTWACVITFFGVFASPRAVILANFYGEAVSLLLGIGCGIYLIVKKEFSLEDAPRALPGRRALRSVLTSPAFWGFVFVFSALTVLNTVDV